MDNHLMPRKARELSALAVTKLRAPGRHAVGGVDGLHLRIAGASRAWVLRLAVGHRTDAQGRLVVHRRDIGLGSFPEVSLADARDQARLYRRQVREGTDPLQQRQHAKVQAKLAATRDQTFAVCTAAYIEANRAGWKNPKHAQQWENTLKTYAHPMLGASSIAAVDTAAILAVLQQSVAVDGEKVSLWQGKTETASRLRGRIESILDWAAFRGYRQGDNPARWKGHLQHELPSRAKVQRVKHHAALPYAELPGFMKTLRQREGISARALEFAILTAARSAEVRGATWQEIDLPAQLWTIPAERMKAGKEHRVPLSKKAVELLEALPRFMDQPLIFPAPRGGQLSDMALTAALKRMDYADITQHGFRSTFRDWAAETTAFPREVIEHALAHQLKDKAEAAYQRGDLLVKRTQLMGDWAAYGSSKP